MSELSNEIKNLSLSEKCSALLDVESKIDALAKKKADLDGATKGLRAAEDCLRASILEEMVNNGVATADECGVVFAVTNQPQRVIVTDESAIPDDYFKTTRTLDKTLVNKAVKDGFQVPGTTLSNGGQTLTIRAKGRN